MANPYNYGFITHVWVELHPQVYNGDLAMNGNIEWEYNADPPAIGTCGVI